MPNADEQRDNELLENLLDGLMSENDRQSFQAAMRNDPTLQRQARLQGDIDDSLRRLFAFEAPPREALTAMLAGQGAGVVPPQSTIRPLAARRFGVAAVLAASLLVAISLLFFWSGRRQASPYVAARPLVELYRNAVASGFEPSYECHEPERFADAFQRRQGRPLRLLPMPEGVRMLGLAYTGGLSRDTTAMLCYVDDHPVMVFVDRSQNDRPQTAADQKFRLFREERDDLVFYEATPLREPKVTQLLAPLKNAAP